MVEAVSQRGLPLFLKAQAKKCITWAKANRGLFILMAAAVLVALIPFYGNLFPPLVDLPEHLLVSKLLWEKLAGVSNLDLQISWFLGYKLFPYLMLVFITFFKTLGISLVYLPKIVSMALVSLFSILVAAILYFELEGRSWRSYALLGCMTLPAVVSMYSAAWFIGFVNYTLAVTLLVPAIVFAERYVRAGKPVDAILLFLCMLLAYTAHPFVPTFWLMWCFARTVASVSTWHLLEEWKRLIMLGVLFLPIGVYHLWATSGTNLAPPTNLFGQEPPFVTFSDWCALRLYPMLDGTYFRADDAAYSEFFGIFGLGFVLFATVLAFLGKRRVGARRIMLSSLFFAFVASLVNEKFVPVPGGHWLAYDYRFSTTVSAVCVVMAAVVVIRCSPALIEKRAYRLVFAGVAVVSAVVSLGHLYEVRSAYSRFDDAAREYMDKVFSNEDPAAIYLPHSHWHPDGTLIKLYICMEQADCNPNGTTFYHGYSGDLYPVKYGPNYTHEPRPAPTPTPEQSANRDEQLSAPRGIASDSKGNLYVADTGNKRVVKFDPDGRVVLTFGVAGEGVGAMKDPVGIAVDAGGNIYVTDLGSGKLMRFDGDGKFVKEWRGPDPTFYGPDDVAVGPSGQLYIADEGNGRIVRFDPATETFTAWGSKGEGEGQVLQPTGLTVGGGFVFVADLGSDRIVVFGLDGKFIRQWDVPVWGKYPWHYPDLVLDEKNKRLFATSGWTREVLAFDLEGKAIPGGFKPEGADQLHNPSSLSLSNVKNKQRLVVLNTDTPKVSIFDLEGQKSQ